MYPDHKLFQSTIFVLAICMSGLIGKAYGDSEAAGANCPELQQSTPIRELLEIPYANNSNPRQRLDLFLPEKPKSELLPTIVFIHGGAWMEGDKSSGASAVKPYVASGKYAGVSVGYRLSDEVKWPSQMHDVSAAIRWIRANSEKYGLNADRIAVWGPSAGGHLALMVGLAADTPELAGDIGKEPTLSSRVSGIINLFGVTDIVGLLEHEGEIDRHAPDAPEALLLGGAIPDIPDIARSASPITHVGSNSPPVLTAHGTLDDISPFSQAERLHSALRASNVPEYLVSVTDAGHGRFPKDVDVRINAFLEKVLLDRDGDVSTAPVDGT